MAETSIDREIGCPTQAVWVFREGMPWDGDDEEAFQGLGKKQPQVRYHGSVPAWFADIQVKLRVQVL
jgi:hypothetical protein